MTWRLGPSPIHGSGVFATLRIRKGETLERIPLRDFHGYNHSCHPNLNLQGRVAIRDIYLGEEITVDYGRYSPLLRKGLCNCISCFDPFKTFQQLQEAL